MSQNEQLREALLEIEVLRARERQTLQETRALLDILKQTTANGDPAGALQRALRTAAGGVGADVVVLARSSGQGLEVEASSATGQTLASLPIPPAFVAKPRNVSDVGRVAALATLGARFQSLLCVPHATDTDDAYTLIALHAHPRRFTRAHQDFLGRVSQLIAQAVLNRALSAQNALLAAVIDGSSASFAIADATDEALPLVFVNKAFERLTGYTADEVLGRNCRMLTAEQPGSPERARLRDAVARKGSGRFLLRNRRADGSEFWNDLTLFPVTSAEGQVTQLVATQTDVTERVLAEAQVRTAQERLQSVLDHTRDAFVMVEADGTVVFANAATREMFQANWAVGSQFQDNWAQYLASLPKSTGPVLEAVRVPDLAALATQREGMRTNLPDGTQVLVRAEPAEGGAIVVSATDTTSIRNTERLLKQRAAAVENATDGIAILDADGRITYANRALGGLLGYGSEAMLLGRRWQAHYTVPEEAEHLHAQAGLTDGARVMQRAGSAPRAELHEVSLAEVPGVGEVLVARDITTALRNRRRVAELNSQVEDARRREVISNLAAGLAHDFNNVLSAISGSATLIAGDRSSTEEAKTHAARILRAGGVAARLVNRMLDLGGADDAASVFDLRSVLGEVRALAEAQIASETELVLDAGAAPLSLRANPSDIILALLNLVINASDAHADTVCMRLSERGPDPDRVPLLGRPVPGTRYGCITVEDTGEGIEATALPQILNAFYTTKGSRGTGAGLAMVGAIVSRLDGVIYVTSTLGQGTQVDVLIPLLADSPETAQATGADLTGQAILVLDDQREVAEVMASYLETCGAEVSVLDDPQLAVETILEDPADWTALITDYDMPALSGGDVVEAIRAQAPDFPILVVTALARRLSDRRITQATVQSVFAKPTDLGHLARTLAALEPAPRETADR